MSKNLYDVLETCLTALDSGADLETCLNLFPALSDELRPVLETAAQARAVAVNTPPANVQRRGKARLLQAAAEMREQKAAALPFWKRKNNAGHSFRLAFSALAVIAFMLTGGTGLVSASSSALPGDHLYPVKRGWEDVQLAFIFDPHEHEHLSQQFEKERLDEIHHLFDTGRTEHVYFQATVEQQPGNVWTVDGVQILIEPESQIDPGIVVGALVEIKGDTENGGVLKADQIRLLALPSVTPTTSPREDITATPTLVTTPEPSQDASKDEIHAGSETEYQNETVSEGETFEAEVILPLASTHHDAEKDKRKSTEDVPESTPYPDSGDEDNSQESSPTHDG